MPSDVLDAKSVKTLDKKRAKLGRNIKTPEKDELPMLFQKLQEFYTDRNSMMERHIRMARLESPVSADKDGMATGDVRTRADGTMDYTVDPTPLNLVTIAQAMIAEMHPYADVYPTNTAHTQQRVLDCKKFVQALLDTLLKDGDAPMDMANKLMVCGWLPTLTVFDPAKLHQGNNPFSLRVLDPLNFYPLLNPQRQVIYGFYLERVTGAQLVQEYSMFDGVKELIDADMSPAKGAGGYSKFNQYGGSFKTTEFDIVRFYDDTSTALMISAAGAGDSACTFNPVLAKRKAASLDGNMTSLFYTTEDLDDDPYLGLQKHGLGGVPFHLVGCIEETLSPTAKSNTDIGTLGVGNTYESMSGGKMVYYPYLFPIYNTWVDSCRYKNLMYLGVDAWARPTVIYYTENQEYYKNIGQGDTIFMNPDGSEKREVEPPRPLPPEFMTIMQMFASTMSSSTFNTGDGGGGRLPNSARGYEAALNQGTKREKVIIRKIQQSLAAYCEMAIRIMITRGAGEEVFVAGDGRAFGGAYTLDYKADVLKGFVPSVVVELKLVNGLKDPTNVTAFSALQKLGVYSDKDLIGRVLDEPNPEQIIEEAIAEKARTEKDVIQPQIDVEVLKAQNKYLREKYQWTTKNSLTEDQLEDELNHKRIEQDYQQLSQDEKDARTQAAITMAIQKAGMPPGSENGAMPPTPPTGAPGQPPSPGSTMSPGPMGQSMPSPIMPPPGGMGMMPGAQPPMPPPSGMPSGMPLTFRPPVPGPQGNAGPMGPPPTMPLPGRGLPTPMGAPSGFRPPLPPAMPPAPMPSPVRPGQPSPSGLPQGFAKAPGQAQRPVQPLSQFGMGRTGVPSSLMGASGLPGQLIDTPAFEHANAAFAPMDAKIQGPMGSGKKRKRGSRGSGKGGR